MLLPLVILIFISEIFVDWIKHGFITKFNGISPSEYRKYSLVLAKDIVSGSNTLVRHLHVQCLIFIFSKKYYKSLFSFNNGFFFQSQSEYSDLVSRRIGFTPLPLACVLAQTLYGYASFPGISGKIFLFVCFLWYVQPCMIIIQAPPSNGHFGTI